MLDAVSSPLTRVMYALGADLSKLAGTPAAFFVVLCGSAGARRRSSSGWFLLNRLRSTAGIGPGARDTGA